MSALDQGESSNDPWRLQGGTLTRRNREVALRDVELIELGYRTGFGDYLWSGVGAYLWLVLHTSTGEEVVIQTGTGYRPTATDAFVRAVIASYVEENPDGLVDANGSAGVRRLRVGLIVGAAVAAVAMAGLFIANPEIPVDAVGGVAFAAVPLVVACVLLLADRGPRLMHNHVFLAWLDRRSRR